MSEPDFDLPGRDPLPPWLIFTGVSLFAIVLLWYFGLIGRMVASDPTHISLIISVLYVASSLHCLWRVLAISREGDAALKAAQVVVGNGRRVLTGEPVEGRTACRPASSPAISATSPPRPRCRAPSGSTRRCCCAFSPAGCAGRMPSAPSPATR